MKENEKNELENASFNLEDFSELKAEELLSAKELQKLKHERRRNTIRKNSKTKGDYGSWDLWAGSWGFDWA
jgi:hypothetical protein